VQTLKIAATLFVALILQLLLAKYLTFSRYVDFMLLVTVYFSLHRVPVLAMGVGLVAGLAGDKVVGAVLGVGGFSKTLIGYIIAIASIKFPIENRLARVGVVAVASAVNTLMFVGLYMMLEQAVPFSESPGVLFAMIGRRALADTAAALVLFTLLDRLFPEKSAANRMTLKRRFYE
jgi:rod shape-determining protein MreD